MPAYNFKSQFVSAVEAGTKLCTIRGRAARTGTKAYLYTGMRTKACRKLGQGTIAHCAAISLGYDNGGRARAKFGKFKMDDAEFRALAIADGFSGPQDMVDFFSDQYRLSTPTEDGGEDVFSGFMITWELDK